MTAREERLPWAHGTRISTSLASGTLPGRFNDSRDRIPQDVRAALESLPFLLRHFRVKYLAYAMAPEHAWKGNGDAVSKIVRSNRNDRAFIAQDCLSNSRRDHANPKLARAGSFNNRNICETD